MNNLQELVWVERYRPQNFDNLILQSKEVVMKYLSQPTSLPSFIFYSSSPGTGKTSCAKLIIKKLGCDSLKMNSSDERGIDTIREKIKSFVQSVSLTGSKRCIFLDEAHGLTKQAQDSLRNLMETHSNNSFFILTCNDMSKIVEPIISRCTVINFEKPDRDEIKKKLLDICLKEDISISDSEMEQLIDLYYPDIRAMVKILQRAHIEGKLSLNTTSDYRLFLDRVKSQDKKFVYDMVYSGTFDIMGFNRWFFRHLWESQDKYSYETLGKMSLLLADTEKSWNLSANLEVVFLANLIQISYLLQ